MLIRLGHTPDPADAFTFWGLAEGEVDTRGFEFERVLGDVLTLNEWALAGRLEATTVSLHAYPFVQEDYALLPHGARLSSGAGPVVVTREPLSAEELREVEIAVPGRLTTAFLVLRLCLGDFRFREVPFDRVLDEVKTGRAPAGVLIDEQRLTYEAEGLRCALDLGEWWLLEAGLPLPLGVTVARRDLGAESLGELAAVLHDSIEAALASRDRAAEYALGFGRGLDTALGDGAASYVNDFACDHGEEGRQAVTELLRRGQELGAFPAPVQLEFVG